MGGMTVAGSVGKPNLRWAGSLLLAASLLAAPAWAAKAPRLEELELQGELLASNNRGEVLTYHPQKRLFRLWNPEGALILQLTLEDERLRGEAYAVGLRGRRVLVSFFDPHPGPEEQQWRRVVVADLESKEVVGVWGLEGLVLQVVGAQEGWLAFTRQLGIGSPFSARSFEEAGLALVFLSDDGQTQEVLELPPEVAEKGEAAGLGTAAAFSGRAFAVGQEFWFVPSAHYQLWRCKRAGKPARAVTPPPCLAASGRMLSPEETRKRWEELAAKMEPQARQQWEKRAPIKEKGRVRYQPSFLGAVSGVASFRSRVAVAVRGGAQEGCRVDFWDMDFEGIVGVLPLPPGVCPGFMALGPKGLWLPQDSHLVFYPVELSPQPLEDPCRQPPPAPLRLSQP